MDQSKNKKRLNVAYVPIPGAMKSAFSALNIDENTLLPVAVENGQGTLSKEDITVENIIAGMLKSIAFDDKNENYEVYRSFLNSYDPGLAEKLERAALLKEEKRDYDFAEELMLESYRLSPTPERAIELATVYSYMAADARNKGDIVEENRGLKNALDSLSEGIERFGENESLLSEMASFEAYVGELEGAKDYLERYLKVATDDDKREEMKRVLEEVDYQIKNDREIKEAYDWIMLGEGDKALPLIEKFISSNPKIWNGWFLKGWALRVIGKYDEAKETLIECIRLGETNSEIYNELSMCELESGNRELAKTYLETAHDLDENNLSIISNLAYLYLMDNDLDSAREALEKSRYLSGDDEIVKELIEEYERKSGEKIGSVIHEDYVNGKEALKEENDDESSHECHHHHKGGCCCHNHEGGEHHHCHHDHEDGECHHHHREGCPHHHEED